ncbi:hypothetical protein LINPERHAP2_LOCUS17027 [Linum perenne]
MSPLMYWVFVTQTLNSFIALLGGKVLLMMDEFSVMHWADQMGLGSLKVHLFSDRTYMRTPSWILTTVNISL